MFFPGLSPEHVRHAIESFGPMSRLVAMLGEVPEKLATYRRELDALCATYFENNTVRQDFLVTRATKI
jgi:hypothetical protein